MTKPIPLSDLVADDLLIDGIASRRPVGDEPVAALLAALAAHADHPLTPSGRRRSRRRMLSALVAITVGASGAGVAAAVTIPGGTPYAKSSSTAPGAEPGPVPGRPGSTLGAELVRDATGRVIVVGADGTRLDSAWLPDGWVAPLPTTATTAVRASGTQVSRARWSSFTVSRALVLAGLEAHPAPAPAAIDAVLADEARPSTSDVPDSDDRAGEKTSDRPVKPLAPRAGPDNRPSGTAPKPAAKPGNKGGKANSRPMPEPSVTVGRPEPTPTTPEKPAKPTKPEAAGTPAEVGKPTEAGRPAEVETPTEAGRPAEVEKPPEAGTPAPGATPEEPGKPAEPGQPPEPGTPAEPASPAEPIGVSGAEPTEAAAPVATVPSAEAAPVAVEEAAEAEPTDTDAEA